MWDCRVGVTIVAPQEEQETLAHLVRNADLRLMRSTTLDQFNTRRLLRSDVILVDAFNDDERHDQLVSDIGRASTNGGAALLVRTSASSLDPVLAALGSSEATILFEPTEQDIVSHLRAASEAARPPVILHDSKGKSNEDAEADRALEDRLEQMVDAVETDHSLLMHDGASAGSLSADQRARVAVEVEAILKIRRSRNDFFAAAFFADPIWDMLLELLVARLRGVHLPTTGLCASAGVPMTTALRCVRILTKKGIIKRNPDMVDRRRVYVDMTEEAADAMLRWFARAQGQSRLAGV